MERRLPVPTLQFLRPTTRKRTTVRALEIARAVRTGSEKGIVRCQSSHEDYRHYRAIVSTLEAIHHEVPVLATKSWIHWYSAAYQALA
jgi:hypothetical protein